MCIWWYLRVYNKCVICDGCQSTRHTVNSSPGQLVMQPTRHKEAVNSSQGNKQANIKAVLPQQWLPLPVVRNRRCYSKNAQKLSRKQSEQQSTRSVLLGRSPFSHLTKCCCSCRSVNNSKWRCSPTLISATVNCAGTCFSHAARTGVRLDGVVIFAADDGCQSSPTFARSADLAFNCCDAARQVSTNVLYAEVKGLASDFSFTSQTTRARSAAYSEQNGSSPFSHLSHPMKG